MADSQFEFASFYERVQATPKERSPIRQALVRGLKDYYEATYGYDRYGAETIFLVPQDMSRPYIYGFALRRALHDRRITARVKIKAAQVGLDITDYGADGGIPYALLGALEFLARQQALPTTDLRFGLVVSAGEQEPFGGLDRAHVTQFFKTMVSWAEMPAQERLFWGHSLLARHRDQSGSSQMIEALLDREDLPRDLRVELCRAWINRRQPRLHVPTPASESDYRSTFSAEHLPFWVAHASSWPTNKMIHLGLVWLARLGEDPGSLARTYIEYRDRDSEQVHAAVADIISEHAVELDRETIRSVIDRGIGISASGATRRRFYHLGNELLGDEYLSRATTDVANSVRQWAARQHQQ